MTQTVWVRPYQRHTDRELLKMYVYSVEYARATNKILTQEGFEQGDELELRHYDTLDIEGLKRRLEK